MTGRERVNRMFERRDHDRVPRIDAYWDETIQAWQAQGLVGDSETVLEMLDIDFYGCGGCMPVPFPDRYKAPVGENKIQFDRLSTVLGGSCELVEEDDETQVLRNAWGETVRFFKNHSTSTTPEHLGFECQTREDWEKKFKPAFVNSGIQIDLKQAKKNYAKGRAKGRWCGIGGTEPIALLRHLMGDEGSLITMADDPELIKDMAEVIMDVLIRSLDAAMELGIEPDGVTMGGDMAYNHATVCSPAMYRELIWPQHKRLADWGHAHGMKNYYHTDGNVNGVLDLYIEAGIDGLHPLEAKADLDVRTLAPKYGDRLALIGNIDARVLSSNDYDKIEEEISTKFAAGKSCKGYVYHSDHSVPPAVKWTTYQRVLELIEQYGRYD